jgi:flap endonuclease-1
MGNADIRDVAAIESITFDDIAGSTVAVDAHNWLYRYLTIVVQYTDESVYTTGDGAEVANLVGAIKGLPKFFEHDLSPVFVFDGGVTELKADEVERRREAKADAEARMEEAIERGDGIEAARLEARTQRLTDTILETTRELFDLLDVPVIDAPAEGEAQAAYMARRGDVDLVGTEDYDALLFGAPQTVRKLTTSDDPELMDFDATLAAHDLTWEQLVDVAILCGTDFNEGVHGIGPATAIDAIHEHGDLWGVLEAREETVQGADRVRSLFLDPDVTEDYEITETADPDVDAARRFVTEEWGVSADAVSRAFERIEDSLVQTGLDRWA